MSTPKYLAYAALALGVAQYLVWRRKVRKLPPGPPKLPFVDNLFNMPVGLDSASFAELGRKYKSDIIHLSALGTSIVVLNSFESATELLERRSGIYSSRPVSVMTHELTEIGTLLSSMVYGDRWRAGRRLFSKYLVAGTTINQSRDIYYIRRFLHRLLEKPDDLRHHIGTLLSAISLSMTYGIRPEGDSDPYVKVSEEAATSAVYLVGQAPYMVDLIPWLKYLPTWFPGTVFHKDAGKCTRSVQASRETLFRAGTAVMTSADYTPSFLSQALQSIEGLSPGEARDEERLIKDVANIIYLAAFDTSVSGIETFFLAMACYPDIQRRAQKELDSALKGRLPEHSDLESLPYLTALVMELLRWKPATPAGVPHTVILDDVYKGYFIPKDSMIVANQWGMLHDPEVYPEPSEFRPERYLKDGKINDAVRNPTEITFGFGRRTCPGRHIAQATLKMTVASVLLMFDIQKSTDAEGRVIEPNLEYNTDVVSKAKELSCTIKSRSRIAEETIKTWISVEGDNPP